MGKTQVNVIAEKESERKEMKLPEFDLCPTTLAVSG